MLKSILSISGKQGLYKLVSQGKNMLIVESLQTKKRQPAYANEKVVSLGDIAIYTTEEEVPLGKVLQTIYEKEGKEIQMSQYKTPEDYKNFFLEILPNYDQERVYNTDIKKIMSWYNVLVASGMTEFYAEEKKETSNDGTESQGTEAENKD